jgi:hypothetical protein
MIWAMLLIFCAALAVTNTAFASEASLNTTSNGTNSTLDQYLAETNTQNNSNNINSEDSIATNFNNNSTAAGTDNAYNNLHGIWIQTGDVKQLNVAELKNAGITDIFVKCNTLSQPTYDTILPVILKMVEGTGINVNAWITCFKDANGNWVDPQGSYTYTVQVPYTTAVQQAYVAYWYKQRYKAYYKVKSRGKWITKYRWKYRWAPHYNYRTVYQTLYKSETRNGYDGTFNNNLINAIADITTKYNIAGIHLDYVRYPGTAYKYSGSTAAITNFVHTVYDTVKTIKPNVAVSAALMPEGSVNAYYYGQDYGQLAKYLDLLVPMIYKGNYGKDTAWIGTTTSWIVNHSSKPVIVGLQTYESDSNLTKLPAAELNQDTKAATDNGASGYVLFRYGLLDENFSDTSGSNSTPTAGTTTSSNNSMISIADIETAANSVKSFIETNHRLPAYVTISNNQIQIPAYLNLLVDSVININSGSTARIVLKDYQSPSNPSETLTSGNIQSAEYLTMAKSIVSYMETNGAAPNYATSSLGNVQYESLVYMYSKIANFVSVNGRLPNYVSMTPWTTTTNTHQTIASDIAQYLQPTANCQSTNAQIIATANSIIQGATDPLTKATRIYNWVRDNIGYSFYYNTKNGAVGTLNAKTANCCDTTHLLIALERAAGIPAEYVHGYCQFTSSGNWYGHVWAQLYVNGKWYTADAISLRNSFGVINNWNTATYTLYGVYKELPF